MNAAEFQAHLEQHPTAHRDMRALFAGEDDNRVCTEPDDLHCTTCGCCPGAHYFWCWAGLSGTAKLRKQAVHRFSGLVADVLSVTARVTDR